MQELNQIDNSEKLLKSELSLKLPLISVITISLNSLEFIKQTIESVLTQTYPNIEYLVIDGASTDGTVEIIEKYDKQLAYWHSRPDRGLSHAFNLGLERARGDWLVLLNSDDFFLSPKVIENIVPYLMKYHDKDVVFGQAIIMSNQKSPTPLTLTRVYGHTWRWEQFRWFDTIPHPAAFTNKSFFRRVGKFDETFKVAMDYEFYLRRGKNLEAQFIPIPVSGMRAEGLSSQNIVNTWREGRRAQEKNRALPAGLAWINFFYQIGRNLLGKAAHIILDPFAKKISCSSRISGKLA
jgi:glycosyltransferase involved in cell wall biosynthesis